MPKASLNPDKASQGGGGVEAGNYQIDIAKFQNLKTDFQPNQLYLVFSCSTLDKDGAVVRGADPVEMRFSFGKKSLEAFHPGNAGSADDTEPEDLGDGVEVEGNTIYFDGNGEQFNKSCGALVFMETLAKAGYPKSLLDRCYGPDLQGIKFALLTLPAGDINSRFGTRLNAKPMIDEKTKEERPVTYKIADKWLNPQMISADSKPTKAAKGEKAEKPAVSLSVEDMTKAVLAKVALKKAGEKNSIKSSGALKGFFTSTFASTYNGTEAKKLAECQSKLGDPEWLEDALAELGGVMGAGGSVVFPEAPASE